MVKPLITIQSPLLTSLMLVSHCGEYVANGLTSAIRHQFVMIANDRQTFVDVRKHSRSLIVFTGEHGEHERWWTRLIQKWTTRMRTCGISDGHLRGFAKLKKFQNPKKKLQSPLDKTEERDSTEKEQ